MNYYNVLIYNEFLQRQHRFIIDSLINMMNDDIVSKFRIFSTCNVACNTCLIKYNKKQDYGTVHPLFCLCMVPKSLLKLTLYNLH